MRLLASSVALFVSTFFSASASLAHTLPDVQGAWEIRFSENGRPLRAVKTIKDDVETTSTYDGDRLVYEHVCKIELIETNGFTIVKWTEATVTVGPQKGTKKPSGSCLAKLDGNKWYQTHGLHDDEKNPPSLQVFTKSEPMDKP